MAFTEKLTIIPLWTRATQLRNNLKEYFQFGLTREAKPDPVSELVMLVEAPAEAVATVTEVPQLPEDFETFLDTPHFLTKTVVETMKLFPDTRWRFIRVPDGIYVGWEGSLYHADLTPNLFGASDGGFITFDRGNLVLSGYSPTLEQKGMRAQQQLNNREYTEKLVREMLRD